MLKNHRDRASLTRRGIVVISGALSWGMVSWLLGAFFPPQENPPCVREKFAHLTTHRDDYDALFLGSSRIQNHVMCRVFDQLAGIPGLHANSFNARISSMHMPEDDYCL